MPNRLDRQAGEAVKLKVARGVKAETMSGVDAAWLDMEEASNPMVINAVLEFDGRVELETFRQDLATRLLGHPRFCQRPAPDAQAHRWIPDLELCANYHLPVRTLAGTDFERLLRVDMAREISTSLDFGRPLWRVVCYPRPDGGLSCLMRAHHAVADGVALVKFLTRLAQPKRRARRENAHTTDSKGPLAGAIAILKTLDAGLLIARRELALDLEHPTHLLEQAQDARRAIMAAGRILALPDDNPAVLRAPLSGRRQLAWCDEFSLTSLRAVAQRRKVKLNDVFLSCLAGAFHRYLSELDPRSDAQTLRISVPVNLRADQDAELGNFFGLVLLDLPVGPGEWEDRLRLVKGQMDKLKNSPEAKVMLVGLATAGHLPSRVEKWLINSLAGKSAAVVSNLPGPERPLDVCGITLKSLIFWPPQTGHIGIGISLFSYNGQISVGVSADDGVMPRPEKLIAAFRDEFALVTGC